MVWHGAACVVSSSRTASDPVPMVQPVAGSERRPVDPEEHQVLAVRAGERLVAVVADPFDRLLGVQADGLVGAAVHGLGLGVVVPVKAELTDACPIHGLLRHPTVVAVAR